METPVLAQCRTQGWFEKGRREMRSSSAIKTKKSPLNLNVSVHIQTRHKKNPANIHEHSE